MDHQELWKSVLGQIELSISKANFVTWFQGTAIVSVENDTAIISVPNGFAKEWLENKYNHTIIQSLRSFDEHIRSIRCVISGPQPLKKSFDAVVQPGKTMDSTPPAQIISRTSEPVSMSRQPQAYIQSAPKQATALFHETNLNPRYTFKDYIVAENNELANAACVAVSRNLGQIYNPLFIYGGVGLGKTHLLQALGNEVKKEHPEKNIKYITSERFTSELVDSIKNQRTDKFKEYYQQMDLLIIDDVQFLSGREKTQNEFFHIFNALYQLNKQIVISSDRPPKAIPTLEDRLRSRFEGGMITDISQPNEETRLAILRKKVMEKPFSIDEGALRYIAENITQNVREIEGALNRVIAYSEFYKTPPSIALVEKVLSQLILQNKKNIQTTDIVTAVEKLYSVSKEDLLKKGRKKGISNARQVAMYLMRTELNMPFSSIGEYFGGRDHTTALHAFEKIHGEIGKNLRLKGDVSSLKNELYQSKCE